jgi:hypothetical protein
LKPHKKILYQGQADGHGVETIIWCKDQFIKEWELALTKYSTFVLQSKMAEINRNDINYYKG